LFPLLSDKILVCVGFSFLGLAVGVLEGSLGLVQEAVDRRSRVSGAFLTYPLAEPCLSDLNLVFWNIVHPLVSFSADIVIYAYFGGLNFRYLSSCF